MEPMIKETVNDPDRKYITFKREEFYQMMGELALPPGSGAPGDTDCALLAEKIVNRALETELLDAVVIRRQDLFASPALATYAACISMVSTVTDDKERQKSLLQVADYFQRQSELAAEEGWKLPTP